MTQQIEQLLEDVRFKIGTLREARSRFADQLAPEFRIFDFLRTDEMGLSLCIASLLNPKGKHGQGSVFLDAFLKILGDKASWATNFQDCQVLTEKQANGQRRIDIYLEFKNGIIGIENKPWADCQENQLTDYADFLKKTSVSADWLLVFLSERDPNKRSLTIERRKELEDDGKFVQRDYGRIIEWLETCACKSKASVVRVFIEELAKFVRTSIKGEIEMSDEREVTSAVLKSSETLGSAFQISKVMDAVKKELLKKFHGDLVIGLENKGLKLADWGLNNWQSNTGFNIQFGNSEQNLYLRFEFDKTNLTSFFWGIYGKSNKYHNATVWGEVSALMTAEFYSGKSSKPSPWWPWYSEFDNEFDAEMKNWSISEKPWIMIRDGEMASKIIDLAVRVRDVFIRDHKLNRLCEGYSFPTTES